MCRFALLFSVWLFCSLPAWSQAQQGSSQEFFHRADSALAQMSPEQRSGALTMLQLLGEEFPQLEAQLNPASNALEQTEKPLLNLSLDIQAVQQAASREVLTWKLATLGSATAGTAVLCYLLYLGVSGHIRL